jgi:hypothetical protein
MAVEEQVRAYGGPQFQLLERDMNRFAEAIEQAKVDVVPRVSFTTGGAGGREGATGGGGGNLLESMLSILVSDKLQDLAASFKPGAGSANTEAVRQAIRAGMTTTAKKDQAPPER